MAPIIKPFEKPIYITRPLLPNLDEFKNRLKKVWDAQWLTNNGVQHQLLEEQVRQRLGVPHLSLFNNGTIALVTACQSLRLSGEVITTPFTFAATPHVLTWNNIKPIFCDIEPTHMNIDANKIESMITPQTTAILAVHVFGNPCKVLKIQEVADRYGLKVIYDAAHAFGTEIQVPDTSNNITLEKVSQKKSKNKNSQPSKPKEVWTGIGNFGDITMFSFHSTKLFHSAEGGALTFGSPHLKGRIDLLKNFGIKNEEEVVMPGINGKMNEIQAVLGLLVLDMVNEEKQKRKKILETYHTLLREIEGVEFVELPATVRSSYQYFVVRIQKEVFGKSRDQVFEEFKKYNVITRKYFYPLCSEYTCYSHLPSSHRENLPVAHKVASEVLALPFYGGLQIS
jgi:dTDP-4-amino-4,6-dideoxygalactose transaminase